MLAAVLGADCEATRDAFLGQPASALSSAAFLVVGVWALRRARGSRARRRELAVFGTTTILVGLGSFAFHGPHPDGSQWAHDVTIAWLLLLLVWFDVGAGGRGGPSLIAWAVTAAAIGVVFFIWPDAQRIAYTLLGGTLVVLELDAVRAHRRPRRGEQGFGLYAFAATAFVLGTLSFFVGRLDVLCDPTSWLQWHAVWHVSIAAALAAYVEVTLVVREA